MIKPPQPRVPPAEVSGASRGVAMNSRRRKGAMTAVVAQRCAKSQVGEEFHSPKVDVLTVEGWEAHGSTPGGWWPR